MNKAGSLELSVNFIVIMIISILVLGGGFLLLAKGLAQGEDELKKIDELHKAQIKSAMAKSGELVLVYPNTIKLMQGDSQIFTVGVNNELGTDEKCYIVAKETPSASPGNELLYTRTYFDVKNTGTGFTNVKVTTSKERGKVSYIFNFCIFAGSPGSECPSDEMYGDMQKVIVNVK